MLNMDEIRMGGTCRACRGRNMGELLGECITRQVQILRRHMPGAEVYIWCDMLDPNHNAHGDYYLVEGDFTGSWKHIPKDLTIAVWGGAPREKSLRFFADQGFQHAGGLLLRRGRSERRERLAGIWPGNCRTSAASCTRPGRRNTICFPNSATC